MYEARHHKLISRRRFARRLASHAAVAFAILGVSLAIGMAGYRYFEHLAWRDAFLNAAMLLGGEGPVTAPRSESGKVFAGVYGLYAGILVLLVTGIVLAPVLHRLLHRFHLSDEGSGE
jgi:hypothetical protein